MRDKSASELLHGLLMKEEVGFKFTMQTLKDMAAEAEVDVTEGAITGFIYRAFKLGRVKVVGKVEGNGNRLLHQYEIVNREPWVFKPKGYGSNKGRTISNKRHNPVLPVEPEMKTVTSYPLQSLLSDRLFALIVEVAELEKKSLKDYTTDELITELKTRVK